MSNLSEEMAVKAINSSEFNVDYYGDYEVTSPCTMDSNHNVELVMGPYIHSIICILGFIGNSLVIVTYAFYKKAKSMTDVYLLNVAIADLLFVAVLPLIVYNEQSAWAMGDVACKLLRGSYSVNLYSGMLLLACISTDRYIAIVQARRSSRLRSLLYSRIICSVVWVLALVLSIPTFHYYRRYLPSHTMMGYGEPLESSFFTPDYEGTNEHNHTVVEDDEQQQSSIFTEDYEGTNEHNHTVVEDDEQQQPSIFTEEHVCEFWFADNETAQQMKTLVPSAQMAVGFFLPLFVMVFCYTNIIITLLHAKNFQRHKAVRVVLAVVAVFIICHLPYNITLLYDTIFMFQLQTCSEADSMQVAVTVTKTIAYLHCCLNPVLYAFIGVRFRSHFRKILADLWCLGKRYITPRRFSRVTSEINVSSQRSVDGSSYNKSSFTM